MQNDQFKALVMEQEGQSATPHLRELNIADLPDNEVLVRIHYSSLNFKDSMALADRGIIRKFPTVPGIDLAGVVVESSDSDYQPGDPVIGTGWGIGERYWGGYSQYARVKADWLVPLPAGLSLLQAMQIGTAGLTAMLCLNALELQGIEPGRGPIVVTGASGGVGSVALLILAQRGYETWALTSRTSQSSYLKSLGATKVVPIEEYAAPSKPGRHTMEAETFAAAIDTVGGNTLSSLIARAATGGAIAVCGLVGGTDLDTTVFPFILRGISLLGIDSVRCPTDRRLNAWERLGREAPLEHLGEISRVIPLEQVLEEAEKMRKGLSQGRIVVNLLSN